MKPKLASQGRLRRKKASPLADRSRSTEDCNNPVLGKQEVTVLDLANKPEILELNVLLQDGNKGGTSCAKLSSEQNVHEQR